MSIFQRFTHHHAPQVMVIDPAVLPRFRYPNGVFAVLTTTPDDVADRSYEAFRAYHLTPGVAEREVAKLLMGAEPVCLPVESSPGYAYEVGRERTDLGRMRVFAHYLVRMQLTHESNQQQLLAIREIHHARRLRILPGCCEVCDKLAGRTWRVADPPELPVRGCLRQGGCRCSYVPEVD
ncbi:MAG TPA: hypothetical protein VFV93_08880 [Thermomicrobiales bacterium]|nr:hypothetical protein [Thermomicrobiales bacterium]